MMGVHVEKKSLREELFAMTEAVKIHALDSFSFKDVLYSTATAFPANALGLVDALRNVFYSQCYTRPAEGGGNSLSDHEFLMQLMRATPTVDRWDAGWTIYQVAPNGTVLVQKGERSRAAVHGEYATNKPPGFPPQQGDVVNLRVHPGSSTMQHGFYYVFGDTLSDQFDESALLRFYFNVTDKGAALLLRAVASELNRFQVPFRYKTLSSAAAYTRADAAVLYCAKRYHRVVMDILQSLPEEVRDGLRVDTPLFTKTLGPGIGLAEEPSTGESFGMHRCRLVAEGIVNAWLSGNRTVSACMAAVEARFSQESLQLDQLWLNAGSVDFVQPVMEACAA
jgi:hypothetical protein